MIMIGKLSLRYDKSKISGRLWKDLLIVFINFLFLQFFHRHIVTAAPVDLGNPLPLEQQLAITDSKSFANIAMLDLNVESFSDKISPGEKQSEIWTPDPLTVTAFRVIIEELLLTLQNRVKLSRNFEVHSFLKLANDLTETIDASLDLTIDSRKLAISYYAKQYSIFYEEIAEVFTKLKQLSKFHFYLVKSMETRQNIGRFLKLHSFADRRLICPNMTSQKASFMMEQIEKFGDLNEIKYLIKKLSDEEIMKDILVKADTSEELTCLYQFLYNFKTQRMINFSIPIISLAASLDNEIAFKKFSIFGAIWDKLELHVDFIEEADLLSKKLNNLLCSNTPWNAAIYLIVTIVSEIDIFDPFKCILDNELLEKNLASIKIQCGAQEIIMSDHMATLQRILNYSSLKLFSKANFFGIEIYCSYNIFLVKATEEKKNASILNNNDDLPSRVLHFELVNKIPCYSMAQSLLTMFTGFRILELRFAAFSTKSRDFILNLLKKDIYEKILVYFKRDYLLQIIPGMEKYLSDMDRYKPQIEVKFATW